MCVWIADSGSRPDAASGRADLPGGGPHTGAQLLLTHTPLRDVVSSHFKSSCHFITYFAVVDRSLQNFFIYSVIENGNLLAT